MFFISERALADFVPLAGLRLGHFTRAVDSLQTLGVLHFFSNSCLLLLKLLMKLADGASTGAALSLKLSGFELADF